MTTSAPEVMRPLATVGSLLAIAVHHLGYGAFGGARARPKLVGALVGAGCTRSRSS